MKLPPRQDEPRVWIALRPSSVTGEEAAVFGVKRGARFTGVSRGVEQVRVDTKRDGGVGVPELTGDEHWIPALVDEDAREGVAEAVAGHAVQIRARRPSRGLGR